jgi:hypothetical protein
MNTFLIGCLTNGFGRVSSTHRDAIFQSELLSACSPARNRHTVNVNSREKQSACSSPWGAEERVSSIGHRHPKPFFHACLLKQKTANNQSINQPI